PYTTVVNRLHCVYTVPASSVQPSLHTSSSSSHPVSSSGLLSPRGSSPLSPTATRRGKLSQTVTPSRTARPPPTLLELLEITLLKPSGREVLSSDVTLHSRPPLLSSSSASKICKKKCLSPRWLP
ncbi:hypothetical protein VIGAN_01244100, partial [Vigna angularis var. angularis]